MEELCPRDALACRDKGRDREEGERCFELFVTELEGVIKCLDEIMSGSGPDQINFNYS